MSTCTRCQDRPVSLSCATCQSGYCSKRCQHLDTRYGSHTHTVSTIGSIQATLLGNLSRRSIGPGDPLNDFLYEHRVHRQYRFAQSCANYSSFGIKFRKESAVLFDRAPSQSNIDRHQTLAKAINLIHPLEHANPNIGLVLVPYLENSIYLHLGEDTYESTHVSSIRPFRAKHVHVDLSKIAEEVGQALGQLQFGHGVDGYNFALTWTEKGGPRLHLDLLYTNSLQPTTPESIQCFGSVLGLSPYVPRADQGELFQAFCRGYAQAAGEVHTREIVEVMKTFLS